MSTYSNPHARFTERTDDKFQPKQRAFEHGEEVTSFHVHFGLCSPISDTLLRAWAQNPEPSKLDHALKALAVKLSDAANSRANLIAQNIARPMWYTTSFKPDYLTIFLHIDLVEPFANAVNTSPNTAARRLAESLLRNIDEEDDEFEPGNK